MGGKNAVLQGSIKVTKLIDRLLEPKNPLELSRQRFDNSALARLIIPIVIEQFLALLVGLADTLMISYAGDAAISGVSLVDQINSLYHMVFSALASGGAVVASQYVGSGNRKNGCRAAGQLTMVTALIGILMSSLTLVFGRQIFNLLFGKVEASVFDNGIIYLRISAFSYVAMALYNACAGLYRSMGKTKTLMYVSLAMNLINVVGNAVGIFVLKAGVRGVAYPSLISRVFAAIVMLWLLFSKDTPLRLRLENIFAWDGKMIARLFRIAIPSSIENGLFQLAKIALSSIIALFGTAQIAAYGVAQSFWGVTALFPIAMGPAFITVVGQYMGAQDIEGAEYYSRKLLRITYFGGTIWGLFFLAVIPPLLMLFNLSSEAHRLALILVVVHNIMSTVLTPMAFSLSNGLQAAGDVRFTMAASILSTVVVRVVFAVVFGIWLNLGVIGVVIAMVIDWSVKSALVQIRFRGGKWKSITVI